GRRAPSGRASAGRNSVAAVRKLRRGGLSRRPLLPQVRPSPAPWRRRRRGQQRMTRPRLQQCHWRLLAFACLVLTLAACSLAGDVTPPPGGGGQPTPAASQPAATTVPISSPLFPAAP